MLPLYELRKSDLTVKRNNYELNFPEHIHKYIEIIYVYTGFQRLKIENTEYTITAGNAAVIFPDTIHSYTGSDKNKPEVLILMADPKLFGKLFGDLNKYRPESSLISAKLIHNELRYALNAIRPEQKQDIRFSWTCVIMSYILDILNLNRRAAEPVEDITYKIIKYIEENFTEEITRKTLARQFNVSECYISRIFTQKLHMNLCNYIGLIRAEYAATLIRTTNETFTAISSLAGFGSLRTFNRIFRAAYGMTPKEYKQNISKFVKED